MLTRDVKPVSGAIPPRSAVSRRQSANSGYGEAAARWPPEVARRPQVTKRRLRPPIVYATMTTPVVTGNVVVDESCFSDAHLPALLDELQRCPATAFDVEHSTIQFGTRHHAEHEHPTHA